MKEKNYFYTTKQAFKCFKIIFILSFNSVLANKSPIHIIDAYIPTSGFDQIFVEHSEAIENSSLVGKMYIKENMIIVNHTLFLHASITYEKHANEKKSKLYYSKAIKKTIQVKKVCVFKKAQFKSNGSKNHFLSAKQLFIVTITNVKEPVIVSPQYFQSKISTFVDVLRRKVGKSHFCNQISPKEKHNRYFSLPPP